MNREAQVRAIWRDTTLTPKERQAHIRDLMLGRANSTTKITTKQKKKQKKEDRTVTKTWFKDGVLGCSHYARDCQLFAPCCQTFYTCRLCHDDAVADHTLDRYSVRAMRCFHCGRRQPIRQKCRYCKRLLAEYYCHICHLFIGKSTRKLAFHCDQCGMCRAGKKDAWRHCVTCGTCVPKRGQQHRCRADFMKQNCPICLEDLMQTVRQSCTLPCGHLIHEHCLREMQRQGQWRCGVCQRAIYPAAAMQDMWRRIDMEIAINPMPESYRSKRVRIYCRECDRMVSNVRYHFVAHCCPYCRGYNTVLS